MPQGLIETLLSVLQVVKIPDRLTRLQEML